LHTPCQEPKEEKNDFRKDTINWQLKAAEIKPINDPSTG
jgi:hypothetical protein